MEEELIKKYFYTLNGITLRLMYFKSYKDEYGVDDLKKFNPGHLGSALNINFILANLNYFLNKNKILSKKVIGTGHGGISLISSLFMDKKLEDYYNKYNRDLNGINQLISDFGETIRSEINPQYPGSIYDGGELGYSLACAYGYATSCNVLVPCIIGDGECETGTLSSSWYLNKMLKTKGKVLPIINLNGLKMGEKSFLSLLDNDDLDKYFKALGYEPIIIDMNELEITNGIKKIQEGLNKCIKIDNPLLIIKSKKGYSFPKYLDYNLEGTTKIHKNPFSNINNDDKIKILNYLIKYYKVDISFDDKKFDKFITTDYNAKIDNFKEVHDIDVFNKGIDYLQNFIIKFLNENMGMIFSPDEIYSNQFGLVSPYTFEILNENVLQGLIQGYVQGGGCGFFIGYEGFMPIIDSMIIQYLKYLIQIDLLPFKKEIPAINYILTSGCLENTYSHQNPGFVNNILFHSDKYYNVVYPKSGYAARDFLENNINNKNMINVISISKRCKNNDRDKYSDIEVLENCVNPDIILVATGDYLLNEIYKLRDKILENEPEKRIKLIYISNPKILDLDSIKRLDENEFNIYFNKNIPVIYLYSGYRNIINGLLHNRINEFYVYGYRDMVTVNGILENNLDNNYLNYEKIYNDYIDLVIKKNNVRRKKNE